MNTLLHVSHLSTAYRQKKYILPILRGVSLSVGESEAVGIIGESGSGKTTLSEAILGVLPHKNGVILGGKMTYDSIDIERRREDIIGNIITYIPQDPHSAFDPLCSIEDSFNEVLERHQHGLSSEEKRALCHMALERVHLSTKRMNIRHYPHQLSGGMKQRILIALAMVTQPRIIIADEPTSNLDVMTEHAIVGLFQEIRKSTGVSFLLTTHNLRLARHFCDRVYVLFKGTIVEQGTSEEIFENARHPYTRSLLDALSGVADLTKRESVPAGHAECCVYYERCAMREDRCVEKQSLCAVSSTHSVLCGKAKRR